MFVSRWPARCFVTVLAQLNAVISLPQQEAGLICKRSETFLEKISSGLNKPIKPYRYVENASLNAKINIISPVNACKIINKYMVFLSNAPNSSTIA